MMKTKTKTKTICMPFGKYKGREVSELTSAYLVYAYENFSLIPELKAAIVQEIQFRLRDILSMDFRFHEN